MLWAVLLCVWTCLGGRKLLVSPQLGCLLLRSLLAQERMLSEKAGRDGGSRGTATTVIQCRPFLVSD